MEYLDINFWKRYDENLNNHYMNRYIKFIKSIQNKNNRLLEYKEEHHIIPRSIDLEYNKNDYLISLSAREHYIAHMILAKCFNNIYKYKMEHAFTMMVFHKNMYLRDYKVTSRIYEKCRLLNSQRMKQVMNTPEMKKKVGKRQSKYIRDKLGGKTFFDSTGIPAPNKGKFCITNGIKNKYVMTEAEIPEGWYRGNTQKKKGKEWHENLKKAWAENKDSRVGKNHPMYGRGYLLEGTKNGRYIDGRYCNKK